MCGGGPRPRLQPLPEPEPLPAPAPIPVAGDVNHVATEQQRISRTKNLKRGMLSTIKTNPFGAAGASTNSPALQPAKRTLGA